MNGKDKFIYGIRSAYDATFHKKSLIGKIGYLHDELKDSGNVHNYMRDVEDNIKMLHAISNGCKKGIDLFKEKKYKTNKHMFIYKN